MSPRSFTEIDYSTVHFDGRGVPYWSDAKGGKVFLPPLVAAQSGDPGAQAWARSMGAAINRDADGNVTSVDNHVMPGSSLLKNRGEWDSEKGVIKQGTNWNNIMAMGVGGAMAAPFVVPALAGAAGTGGTAGAAGATLPSSSIAGLHAAVPAAIGSQGVSAGIGAGVAGAAGTAGAAALPSSSIAGAHAATPATAGMGSQGVSQGVSSMGGGIWGKLGKYAMDYGMDYLGDAASGAAKGSADQRLNEYDRQLARDRALVDRTRVDVDQRQGRDRNAIDTARLGVDQNQNRDRNALDASQLGITQNTSRDAQALDRAKFGIDAASSRTKQAAYGDALANVQDVNIDFKPTTGALPAFNVSGGLRPSMFGAGARKAGSELSRQALMALMNKSDVPAASEAITMPTPSATVAMPTPSDAAPLPELSPMTQAGGLEKTLGAIGTVGSLWGAMRNPLKQKAAQMTSRQGG